MERVWVEEPDREILAPTEASFPSGAGCKEMPFQGEHMVDVAGPRDAAPASSCQAHKPHAASGDPQCPHRRAGTEQDTHTGSPLP